MSSIEARFEAAKRSANVEAALLELLKEKTDDSEDIAKTKESIINSLAELYVQQKKPEKIK